jgi:MFS family permease
MKNRGLDPGELAALRAALAEDFENAAQEEAAFAARSLSPAIETASRRLARARAERRSVRLQAWGLAGCMAAFAALAWLSYRYGGWLLESPGRWGWIAGFVLLTLSAIGCLPIILLRKGVIHHE